MSKPIPTLEHISTIQLTDDITIDLYVLDSKIFIIFNSQPITYMGSDNDPMERIVGIINYLYFTNNRILESCEPMINQIHSCLKPYRSRCVLGGNYLGSIIVDELNRRFGYSSVLFNPMLLEKPVSRQRRRHITTYKLMYPFSMFSVAHLLQRPSKDGDLKEYL